MLIKIYEKTENMRQFLSAKRFYTTCGITRSASAQHREGNGFDSWPKLRYS